MISLERRVVAGTVAALLVVFVALFWAGFTAVRSLTEAYVLTRIEHDAEALVAAIDTNPRGQIRLREGRITPVYQQPLSGHYFIFQFADGQQIRSRSLWDETLQPLKVEMGEIRAYQASGPNGQVLLLRTAGYTKSGVRFSLTVAEDLTPVAIEVRRFQFWTVVGLLAALILVIVVQRYVMRRGFRVLDRVRDEAAQISAGRLPALNTLGPVEIRPLTTEINRLLGQTQRRLQRSRTSLGNLAHALKGPLTLLTRELDASSLAEVQKQRLADHLHRVRALIDRELKRARTAGESQGQRFNPHRDLPDLIDALQRMFVGKEIEIGFEPLPDQVLPFDYEDMLELFGNLLENACKWSAGRVRVEVSIDEAMHMRVEDDGPGIPAQERESLLQRGVRLDEQAPGHGLGLAIVHDLVEDYAGRLSLARSERLGGLVFAISLPIHSDDEA